MYSVTMTQGAPLSSFAVLIHCAAIGLATGCGGSSDRQQPMHHPPQPQAQPQPRSSSFDLVGQSWVRAEGRIADGPSTRFMVDTGMGVTLLTPEACKRAGCVPTGRWTGKRMSGQAIEISLARVRVLEVAGHRVENAQVAVFELDSVMHRDLGIEGIAGLDFFRSQAVTFDHPNRRIILEDDSSLEQRERSGVVVPVRVDNDGPSTVVFLPLELSTGRAPIEMEVDSGSLHMILDERFMAQLGIDPERSDVKRVAGTDETGNSYVRHYAPLPGRARVRGAPSIGVESGTSVMFQRIIHDGLLGQEFLLKHVVTFDLRRSRMVFGL